MKYAVYLPPFGKYADVQLLAGLARQAEKAGWDGFFIWDHILYDERFFALADPWVALAVIALETEKIRIGPLVTPLARRRPWKLAREAASVDHLSNGRLTLGVGLGSVKKWDFGVFGDEMDLKSRARLLDEGLQLLSGFWSGEPFSFDGEIHHVGTVQFTPKPIQQPRIPIWVGGKWPRKAPMRRAARWDGACPEKVDGELSPEDWVEIVSYVNSHRQSNEPFDFINLRHVSSQKPHEMRRLTKTYEEAGVTWWLSHYHPNNLDFPTWEDRSSKEDAILRLVMDGPPK